jgi:transcriptional regulator with XRE-family HTH domain
MEQIFGKRLGELRKKLNLKQIEFAKELGLTSAAISAIELGKTPLTEANIRLICLTFGVREEWLREGKGEMMDDEARLSEQERQLLALFRELSPIARKMLIEYAEKLLSDEKALRWERQDTAQNAPGGTTMPPGAAQEGRGEESAEKAVNPVHNKTRG